MSSVLASIAILFFLVTGIYFLERYGSFYLIMFILGTSIISCGALGCGAERIARLVKRKEDGVNSDRKLED